MCCKGSSLVEAVAFITTVIALAVNALGVFTKTWWLDTNHETYGMFTVVNCTDGVCRLAEENTYGWMVVAQVTSLLQFILLFTSLLIQLVGCFCCKFQSWLLNILALGLSLLFSLLHIFILISVYGDLMVGFPPALLPENYVYFQTLPVGLNAMAGTITAPPLVTMIVLYTREVKSRKDTIRDAIKQGEMEREASVKKPDSVGSKPTKAEGVDIPAASNA